MCLPHNIEGCQFWLSSASWFIAAGLGRAQTHVCGPSTPIQLTGSVLEVGCCELTSLITQQTSLDLLTWNRKIPRAATSAFQVSDCIIFATVHRRLHGQPKHRVKEDLNSWWMELWSHKQGVNNGEVGEKTLWPFVQSSTILKVKQPWVKDNQVFLGNIWHWGWV